MKRRDPVRHLEHHGCQLREGARHSIYWHPISGKVSAVPRHSEIHGRLAEKICGDLGVSLPPTSRPN